jgi:hypothetical protein
MRHFQQSCAMYTTTSIFGTYGIDMGYIGQDILESGVKASTNLYCDGISILFFSLSIGRQHALNATYSIKLPWALEAFFL